MSSYNDPPPPASKSPLSKDPTASEMVPRHVFKHMMGKLPIKVGCFPVSFPLSSASFFLSYRVFLGLIDTILGYLQPHDDYEGN